MRTERGKRNKYTKKRLKKTEILEGVLEIPPGSNIPPRVRGASHTGDFLMNLGNLAGRAIHPFRRYLFGFRRNLFLPLTSATREIRIALASGLVDRWFIYITCASDFYDPPPPLVSRVTCIRLVLFSTTFSRSADVPFSSFRLPRMNALFSSLGFTAREPRTKFTFVPYFVVQTEFMMKEERAQTFRQMMKHGPISSLRWSEEKKQINLWRGGDFKERIKPLIVRSEFRWNSSRWLERISEKPRVWERVKSRFHLQRAVAVQPYAVKKSIDRPTNRSLLFVVLPPFLLPVQGSAIGCLSSLELGSISWIETRKNHLSAMKKISAATQRYVLLGTHE